jgi:predicted NBD/HSP70 family sugar kinase
MKANYSIKDVFGPNYRLDKKVNKYLVFESIRKRGPISISEIEKITKLSRPTIDNYIKTFHEKGLIKKEGFGDPLGGRKPNLWKLNNHAGYLIGVDMESPNLNLLLTDLDLNTIQTTTTTFSLYSKKEDVLEMLCREINNIMTISNLEPAKVVGIGIGVPGIIDKYRGTAVSIERIPDWHDVPLAKILKERLHLPIFIENDVMLMTFAEKSLNDELKDEKNLIYIGFRYPSGIAARFFLEGRPYNGYYGNAGFVGHVQVEKNGPPCTCGKRGCLELYADVRSILNRIKNAMKNSGETRIHQMIEKEEDITLKEVGQAADEGDVLAMRVLREAADYLSMGIEYLVSLFDIPLIVLGGSITQAGNVFLDFVKEASRKRLISTFRKSLDVRYGYIGDNAASLGGALLVYKDIFKEPVLL